MRYKGKIVEGVFIDRPNRFIAHVTVDGEAVIAHVKNTGRCRELLTPGARVFLEHSNNPNRKTVYSLIAVYKGDQLINMDSQAPNAVIKEALINNKINAIRGITKLKPEAVYGQSRFDFRLEMDGQIGYIEVKGVTLEREGIALFPDAPTERGTKHLNELVHAVSEGHKAYIIFLIQMQGVKSFEPNHAMDPQFASALQAAVIAGVIVLAYSCQVTPETLELGEAIPIKGV